MAFQGRVARVGRALSFVLLVTLLIAPALAFQPRQETARFDALAVAEPGAVIGRTTVLSAALPAGDPARAGWETFASRHGGGWSSWLDPRSGLPALAVGRGIPWIAGRGNALPAGAPPSLDRLEALARHFLDEHRALLGSWDGQLVLDRAASGPLGDRAWQVVFRQVVSGVPVQGARYDFQLVEGNLVAFGATSVAPVTRSTIPALGPAEARARLDAYLGPDAALVAERAAPELTLVPVDPAGAAGTAWSGARGAGYAHLLAWRFVIHVPGEAPTWVAEIDADSGRVRAFFDDTRYERIKGGVYPVSDDQLCPSGCEQPGYPMPFADFAIDGGAKQFTGDHGVYTCGTLGSAITTTLAGPYVRVQDNCGPISESTTCDEPLDFGVGPGTDCAVPPGASPGNTHASRSGFFHLNRSMEKGRAWLPANNWLKQQLVDNVNINSTCNAYWDGAVNFYKSGGGCRNTGEIMGVFVHEWGHGIDQNDGGGYDNPSEAYADIVAFFETRESCIGRGFFMSQNCDGYGNACLDCTGIRDQDWDMHVNHTPSTPSGFIQNNCGGGSGPCGKETHCEGYLAGEAVWDLAARDLPAMGLDTASAWQTAERLFYVSRSGSGGNAYNCALPNADGCGTSSWFHKFRVADDDDGNLANGTPHAAAIFAAMNRHRIACGSAADPGNQNSSSCPSLARPDVTASAGSNSVTLSWFPVAGAQSYRVLRNDLGCGYGQVVIDRVAAPATSSLDSDVSNNFPTYYRVQAVGPSDACDSPVSECITASAQPFAGTIRFAQPTYGCSVAVEIRVTDANAGGGSVPATIWSSSEPVPEPIVLVETAPGSGKYSATIPTSPGPAAAGDGLLSLAHGDAIDVRYVDADDGQGGTNIPRTDHATGDCIFPVIGNVSESGVTNAAATITWTTDENSDSMVVWGPVTPPANQSAGNPSTTSHSVTLGGLAECTAYYYEVRSTDAASNVARADNGGTWYAFETLGDFGQGLQPCHQGRLTLGKEVLACSDSVELRLVDMDVNLSSVAIDTVIAWAGSTTESAPEPIVLTETGPNTSTFTALVAVGPGAPVAGDGIVQIAHGDTFTARYGDGNDGTGSSRLVFDTAVDDCAGAALSGIRVTTIEDDSAVVRWTTSEPTTGAVDWGTSPALGSTVSDPILATSHQVPLGPIAECGRVYFRVRSTDIYGNQSVADGQGAPFAFNAGMIPGVFRDGFETPTGWTLQGEWQIAAPQGKGSSPGDPSTAFAESKVLGHDLAGLGTHPGDYERGVTEQAISPTINAAGLASPELKFRRWLNVAPGGIARIKVRTSSNTWVEAWNSNLESPFGITESAWSLRTVQLPAGASHANLAVMFEQFGGPGTGSTAAGWTLDRVVVKSGNTAEYDACGACGGAPAFAGIAGARDVDACGDTGIGLSWHEAPSWGTGRGGTYAIFRDTQPAIAFDAAHRVAAGVTGSSWTDSAAPNGSTFYYAVRAENDETCGSGPNNHGLTDANTVASSAVQDATSQVLPATVDSLRVTRLNGVHLRLDWQGASGAASYRVLRSLTPQAGAFGTLGDTATAEYDDLGAGANRETYFYLVRGLNLCGQEGP